MKATELRIGNLVNAVLYFCEYGDHYISKQDALELDVNDVTVINIIEPINEIRSAEKYGFDYIGVKNKSILIDLDQILPIPLTEEWLVRFGFISDPYQDMYIKGWFKLNCDKTRGKLNLWVENITGKVLYIEYVHQLQNFYFAINGEELTINQ